MGLLSTKKRNSLPESEFAVPGRKYPVNDPNHARAALSRVSANGSPKEQEEVKRKVRAKFPSIGKKRGMLGQ